MTPPSLVQRLFHLAPIQVRRLTDNLKQNFWFLPSMAVIFALISGEGLTYIDRSIALSEVPGLSWAATTPDAARGILTTLVGALTSVTGVVLSLMLLILAQTSSQLGPRVVRTVISGNELQLTIATMLATIAFSLTTIRAMRGDDATTSFVPELATLISVIAFFASLGTLIYFVNHVSQMIQAPHVIARIARELDSTIATVSYDESTRARTDLEDERLEAVQERSFPVATTITAHADGYLQAIDWDRLVDVCQDAKAIGNVPTLVGKFVRLSDPLCVMRSDGGIGEESIDTVRSCFYFGERRTPEQDLLTPIMELSEIATRAMSPGINDPQTACMCIDRLTSGILKLASDWRGRKLLVDTDGKPRVVRELPSIANAVDAAFTSVSHYGAADPAVRRQLGDAFRVLQSADLPDEAKEVTRSLLVQLGIPHVDD